MNSGKWKGLGAVILDADRNAFLNYLARNFGPGKRRRKMR